MSLNDFSTVTVSAQGPSLSQVGFGTLLLCAYHTHWTERTRSYTSLAEMVDDGFDTDESGYLMAERAFQQNPKPPLIKIGRLANAPARSIRVTPIAVHGATYKITFDVEDETSVEVSYTADSATTVDEICDGLQSVITAAVLLGITVTPSGGTATHFDLSGSSGLYFAIRGWDVSLLKVEDLTPDPGIAADLNAIRAYDDDWYGFCVSVNAKGITEEAADWAETNTVLFACDTADWTFWDGAETGDIQTILSGKSYNRSHVYGSLNNTGSMRCVAGLAERFPFDPGLPPSAGGTFHAKTLAGESPDPLTPTQKGVAETKGATVYITTAGVNHTLGGAAPSGKFVDQTRFEDWFSTRLQERLAQLQLNNDRIGFTPEGITMYRSECEAQLKSGLDSRGISPIDADGNPPKVIAPDLTETQAADRAARNLVGLQIFYQYAGGIHKSKPVVVNVTL